MAVVTFRVEDKTAYALQRLSNYTGKPKAYFIKAGLQEYLRHFFDKEADARTLEVLKESMGYLIDFDLVGSKHEKESKQC